MDDHDDFMAERAQRIASYSANEPLQRVADSFFEESIKSAYSYNFDWLGMPVIQYPQDLIALQEIIWKTKPDCIIETGIARGGSLIFYASMLSLLGEGGMVVGIDVDIRAHNRQRLLAHPFARNIALVDGSSVVPATLEKVSHLVADCQRIMVCLDSNHTHDHVRQELELYSGFVTQGCYCVVFDTIIEMMPAGFFADRPWDKGNSPKTAIDAFLHQLNTSPTVGRDGQTLSFKVDEAIDSQLLLSAAKGGYLKRLPIV